MVTGPLVPDVFVKLLLVGTGLVVSTFSKEIEPIALLRPVLLVTLTVFVPEAGFTRR